MGQQPTGYIIVLSTGASDMWWVNKVFNFVAVMAAVVHRRVESTVQYTYNHADTRPIWCCIWYFVQECRSKMRLCSHDVDLMHRKKWKGGRRRRYGGSAEKSTIYSLYHRFYNTWLLFKFHLKPWTPVNGVKLVHGLNNLYLRFALAWPGGRKTHGGGEERGERKREERKGGEKEREKGEEREKRRERLST